MKTTIPPHRRPTQGYALIMVLIIATLGVIALSGTMRRTTNMALLNQRNNQYVSTLNAAEAATEKVIARMRHDYMLGGDASLAGNLALYRNSVPTESENPYWGIFEFSDAQGNLNRTYVQTISNKTYTPLQSQFYGLYGWRTVYRVVSNAREADARFDVAAAVQQDVETASIPVFQFAIFYNSLLEFTWAAPLTVRGRTHANADIYVGSAWSLAFNDIVTTTGTIQKKPWFSKTASQYTGSINYNGSPTYRTNVPVLSLPIGTNNTPAAVREIVNLPPAGESVDSPLGRERYYNKAGVVLLVSNNTVRAIIKNSPSDASPIVITSTTNVAALSTNLPFLTLTKTFTDKRENKTVRVTEIDIGKYGQWTTTNSHVQSKFPPGSGSWPNILYVADNRSASSTVLPSVRVMNGAMIPANGNTGFTLATPNPLYVWGHYNVSLNGTPVNLGSTNTSKTYPASLISDAFTVLSGNWNDSQSSTTYSTSSSSWDAANTTINAALITGVVFSTGATDTTFSGGVMNLPRLLEDWGNGSMTLTLNTSMVNLFNSVRATNQFKNPGIYYNAPTRNFNFDQNFTVASKQPPGTPMIGVILRSKWANPPPNTVTYAGP
jgi:hypothetical protein